MERGWWYRATTAERLAQIDGCIELGMTAKQCAMNVGAGYPQAVGTFASDHGRRFGWDRYRADRKGDKLSAFHGKRAGFIAAKKAYESGEPVDFWSVE